MVVYPHKEPVMQSFDGYFLLLARTRFKTNSRIDGYFDAMTLVMVCHQEGASKTHMSS